MKRLYTKKKPRRLKCVNWPVLIVFLLLAVCVVCFAVAGFMQSLIHGAATIIGAVIPMSLLFIWLIKHEK